MWLKEYFENMVFKFNKKLKI